MIYQARRTSKKKSINQSFLLDFLFFLLLSHEAALFPEQHDDFVDPASAVLPAQQAAVFLPHDPFVVVLSSDFEVFVSVAFEAALVPPRSTLFID